MTHIAGHDRSQTLLLPELLNEYVGPENPVRFIDASGNLKIRGRDVHYWAPPARFCQISRHRDRNKQFW